MGCRSRFLALGLDQSVGIGEHRRVRVCDVSILDSARDGMNPDIRPQDDLFGHVNGRWLDEAEIPADKSGWGAFIALADAAEQQVREIITEHAERPSEQLNDEERKIGALYASFMNTERINALGIAWSKRG